MKTNKLFLTAILTASAVFAAPVTYEAEDATLSGGATASGSYVQMKEGDITFSNINIASAGA